MGAIGDGSGNVGVKAPRTSFSNGARCVPETDYSDSDSGGGVELGGSRARFGGGGGLG